MKHSRILCYYLLTCLPGIAACTNPTSAPLDTPPGKSDSLAFDFTWTSLADWQTRSFKGETQYEIVELEDQQVLQATTRGKASMLFQQQEIDLTKTPYLRWRWRIEKPYDKLDERTKNGDDYVARVYVLHQHGFTPLESMTVNYVWSSANKIGSNWPNAFTDKAQMLALQSGGQLAGEWVVQTRNVVDDFKNLFDVEIESIHGLAVMVDGDNSGNTATAWFDKFEFLSATSP